MLSILIVNFNSGDHLKNCLESIFSSVEVDYEVVIVDNNSSDDSLSDLPPIPKLKLVKEKMNHGFSKGCNLAFAKSSGSLIHFLNPDTRVSKAINEVYRRLPDVSDPQIFVTQIEDLAGQRVTSSFAFPTLSNILWAVVSPSRLVRWYLGASVIMSREVYLSLGGFSEDYFMYCDDVDLFYRAYQAGIPSHVLSVSVRHFSGGSSSGVWNPEERYELVERSALIFARKFHLQYSYFIFKHIGALRGLLRGRTEAVKELRAYWTVLLSGAN